MNTGPSGFHNAPVTRGIVVASAIFTVISGAGGRSAKLGVSYQFPDAVASFFLSLPLSSTRGSSSTISRGNVSRTAAANIGQRGEGNHLTSARQFTSQVEPSEYSIATLESMGFDRGASSNASTYPS